MTTKVQGIIPALITPYQKDGTIHESSLRELVRRQLATGVNGFYVGGSTAEAFLLTYGERTRLFEVVVDEVNGAVPVLCHVGDISTDKARSLGTAAHQAGADVISAVPPFYYGFSLDEIKRYYIDIVEAVDLPLILYNFPAFTGITIDLHTAGELFRDERIIGIKHTSSDLYQLERMRAADSELSILNGHDETYLAGKMFGADGAVGSTFNFMAKHFLSMSELVDQGSIQQAEELQHRANTIIEVLQQVGVFPGIKHILEASGIECGGCRKPFRSLTDDEKQLLQPVIDTEIT